MDIKPEEIDQHCRTILLSPRIRNKIVVLCEGRPLPANLSKSPSSYASMEKMPDANFYKACIPCDWKQFIPQFFNSGSRNSVIKTFFRMLDLHTQGTVESYLNPEKLFAIIDLDIQKSYLENYHNDFKNTEDIYNNLYKEININTNELYKHKIFITGLIHKEAYFLLPELDEIFRNFKCKILYKNNKLELKNIYSDMINDLPLEQDLLLSDNFMTAKNRISFNTRIDSTSLENIKHSWNNFFANSSSAEEKNNLVYLLLIIKKAKTYWESLYSEEWTGSKESFLDNIILEIGKYISTQKDYRFHIAHILNYLREKNK